MKNNKQYKTAEKNITSLENKHEQLETDLATLQKSTKQLEKKLLDREQKMTSLQRNRFIQWLDPKHIKQSIRNTAAYMLGRRNLKRLYSKKYKRKQASNDLIPYIRLLYEEGFVEKALHDLQHIYETTSNKYMRRAIAQELALYFANKETKDAAIVAINYIKVAKRQESDHDIIRQLTVIEAECLVRLGKVAQAQEALHKQLQRKRHRDIYLALANTETTIEERIFWLNETLKHYNRQPIILGNTKVTRHQLAYRTLHETTVSGTEVNGPKISVILPAYNAADSIHIAIESMLQQTWSNIELLIVDDCSTDDTYEVMKRYAKKDNRIRLFQTDQNSGPYVARNIALHEAEGEFVTVNDADDWSHSEKLEVQANHLINHPNVIANTSELARLTENFLFHRRGTRGKYIFSNMSSIMFRRKEVIKRIGYWDQVRFAADGEFKRRLVHEFGHETMVDLSTGPLSLPEQSTTSLTGSSAFGYAGFFMGARKEYVDSFSYYHKQADNVYYPYKFDGRLFPVPEPMLPASQRQERQLDVIIVANFYQMNPNRVEMIRKQIEKNIQMNLTTGLVQLYDYNTDKRTRKFNEKIRQKIDGTNVQMIVYGEKIKTDIVLIHSIESLQEKQRYIAKINNRITVLIIDEMPKVTYNREEKLNYNVRQIVRQSTTYFSGHVRIYPFDEKIRKQLKTNYKRELGNIRLASENWLIDGEYQEERYGIRLRDWLVEQNDYKIT